MKNLLLLLLLTSGLTQLQSQAVINYNDYIKKLQSSVGDTDQLLLKDLNQIFNGAETTAFLAVKEYRILGDGPVEILDGKPEGFNSLSINNADFSSARYAVVHIQHMNDLNQLNSTILNAVPKLTHIIIISDIEMQKAAFESMSARMSGVTVLYKISITN